MATTTKLKDYLGRWLTNGTPGTTNATDSLGRNVVASNKDFIGRNLTFDNPAAWVATTAYALNDYARLPGGQIVQVVDDGTSGASAPTPPAVGATVTDATVTWRRIK